MCGSGLTLKSTRSLTVDLVATTRATPDASGATACDDSCGCHQTAGTGTTATVEPAAMPIACTLGAVDMDRRLDDWQSALRHVDERSAIDGGVRLTLAADAPIEEIARLAAAEQDCCRFFAFALTLDHRGTALEVRAPDDGQDVLAGLFGTAG